MLAFVTVVAVALFVSLFAFVYTLEVLVLTSPVTLERALPKSGLGTLICVVCVVRRGVTDQNGSSDR